MIRAIDASGDFSFGQGRQNYLSGEAEINQDIATALKVFLGECFFNTSAGVDWWNLLGKSDLAGILLQCRAVIASRAGVTKITSVNAYLNALTRALIVDYKVSTIFSLQTANSVAISAVTQ